MQIRKKTKTREKAHFSRPCNNPQQRYVRQILRDSQSFTFVYNLLFHKEKRGKNDFTPCM